MLYQLVIILVNIMIVRQQLEVTEGYTALHRLRQRL